MEDTANEPGIDPAEDVELPEETGEAVAEPAPEAEPEPEAAPEPEPTPEPEPEALSLDELVANLADEEAIDEAESSTSDSVEVPVAPAEEMVPLAEPVTEPDVPTPLLRRIWTRAPFWAVDAVWAILTIAAAIALWRAPAATFADGLAYALLVLGGAALAAVGLITGLVVWLVARSRASESERVGLGLAIWTRALVWTSGGVVLWWVGLLLLDLRHAGIIG